MKHKSNKEDALLAFFYNARDYFEKNKKVVYGVITGIVVIIAITVIYFSRKNVSIETAAIELSKVQGVYDAGNYQAAINGDSLNTYKGLLYIVNEHGSTPSGELATILLANSYYFNRDFANAEKYYKEYSGSNVILKAAALAGIAAVYEANNNHIEAAKQFEKAATYNKDIAVNDEYLYYAIRNYSQAKDNESVQRLIKVLKSDYPKSEYIQQVEKFNS